MSNLPLYPVPLLAADIQYAGPIRGVLTPLPGAVLQDNEYGLDVLTRPFFGFIDEIYQLIPKYGESDRFMPWMAKTSHQVTEMRGRTAVAIITYKGVNGDELPPPDISGGYAITTAQLSTTRTYGIYADLGGIDLGIKRNSKESQDVNGTPLDYPSEPPESLLRQVSLKDLMDEQSGEVSVTYNSPTTTILYVARREPKKPKYAGLILGSKPDFAVIDIAPASFKGRPIFNREVQTIRFEKRKAGKYWECMEVNQGILTNLATAIRGVSGNMEGKPFRTVIAK